MRIDEEYYYEMAEQYIQMLCRNFKYIRKKHVLETSVDFQQV